MRNVIIIEAYYKMKEFCNFLVILSVIGCSSTEPINYEEKLNEIGGVFYTKDTNKPYSGRVFSLYDNQKKKNQGTLKKGKLNGVYTFWFENGEKKGELVFKDGKEDGLNTLWYNNGKKAEEGTYKNGKRYGLRTYWYENGEKKKEMNYNKDGKPRWNSY